MQEIRASGLIGNKGKKAEEAITLTSSKLAQLEGKFTWLHTSHKDLSRKVQESLSASQPLMMNAVDPNSGISDEVVLEIRKELEKLRKEDTNININLKTAINELKNKINEKVDDRALNELEDQLTTDIDQTIKR